MTETIEGNKLSEYKVNFDFTTVHKGSRFVGRSGEVFVTAKKGTILNKDDKELIGLCWEAIKYLKPSYKVFMITITEITQQSPSK